MMTNDNKIEMCLQLAKNFEELARRHPVGSKCWNRKKAIAAHYREAAEKLKTNGN